MYVCHWCLVETCVFGPTFQFEIINDVHTGSWIQETRDQSSSFLPSCYHNGWNTPAVLNNLLNYVHYKIFTRTVNQTGVNTYVHGHILYVRNNVSLITQSLTVKTNCSLKIKTNRNNSFKNVLLYNVNILVIVISDSKILDLYRDNNEFSIFISNDLNTY